MPKVTSQSRARSTTARTLDRIGGALALGSLAAAALPLLGAALERLAALLRYPYPHDGLEGTLLHEARLLWAGEPLYQPLQRFRVVSAPYPPVHALLLGLADTFTGPHVFWSGRLISLVAALVVAALIVLTVRRVGGSWIGGGIAATLFLSAPPVLLWATRIKPDMLALLFTALGLYCATRASNDELRTTTELKREGSGWRIDRPSSILYLLSSILFVLAFFTKQSAIAAPLAVGLALLIADVHAFPRGTPRRTRERAGYIGRLPLRWRTLTFGLTYLVLALGIWGLLDAMTAGQYTFHVWVMHHGEGWSLDIARKFVGLLVPYWPSMLLGALLVFQALRNGRAPVPACYVLLAPVTLLGACAVGANHNHLLETLLALALAAGCTTGWVAERIEERSASKDEYTRIASLHSQDSRHGPTLPTVTLILLAGQIALAFLPQQWYVGELYPQETPARFVAFIRNTPGEILSDDPALLYMAGKPIRYDDPSAMGPLAASGIWDQSGLIEDIAAHRFGAILIPVNVENRITDSTRRWTPEVLQAIRANYRLAFRDTIFTYVPK